MSRWPVLLVALSLCACTDRSLDASDSIAFAASDLAGLDLTGVDLANHTIHDLSGQPTPIDLSVNTQVGVPCGGTLCTTGQTCCVNATAPQCLQPMMGGPGGGGCGFGGESFACDGPEDCTMGRRCVGSTMGNSSGAPTRTSCRMNTMGGDIVCHADADCRNGQTCTPTMQSTAGAPMLSICQ